MNFYLFQVSFGCAEKDDGEIAGGGGGHGRQKGVVDCQDGPFNHRFAAAQRRVHVQSAKILTDRLQFLFIATQKI